MPFFPLQPSALRLGLYIKIKGSWFSHPFPTNSFKIRTTQELATLQGLTKVELFYDPDRSDADSAVTESQEVSSPQPTEEIKELEQNLAAELPSPEQQAPEEEEIPEDPLQRKLVQHEAFKVYQDHLQDVHIQFQGVVQEGKQMLQDMVTGRPRGLRTANKIVENLSNILDESDHSRALLNLIGSNEANDEFLFHAINVCSLSLMIGRDLKLRREDQEKLGLGALFHDIGELKYPAEKLLRKGGRSPGELKTFLSTHPKYGVEMVERLTNFPYEAVDVIRNHHERLNGTGHPYGKKSDQISTLAKIVMVVDEYDELCHHPNPSKSLAPSEALSYLYVKCRQTLWHDAVVSLICQLGVYPPGSLVQLSNEKIGIVTSVHSANRLRPIVLVYEEENPHDEPIVLNLAQEDRALCIVEVIRPGNLSSKIRESLNPRRILSYFPSSAPSELPVDQVEVVTSVT